MYWKPVLLSVLLSSRLAPPRHDPFEASQRKWDHRLFGNKRGTAQQGLKVLESVCLSDPGTEHVGPHSILYHWLSSGHSFYVDTHSFCLRVMTATAELTTGHVTEVQAESEWKNILSHAEGEGKTVRRRPSRGPRFSPSTHLCLC